MLHVTAYTYLTGTMIFKCVVVLLWCFRFTESEVVDKHFAKCAHFFYKGTPPQGFDHSSLKAICQRYHNVYRFASLHSPDYRIPIYSAYRLDTLTCPSGQPTRRSNWFVEPQLSGSGYSKEMSTEGALSGTFKRVQAINIDYPNTNYDRGHLNPNFYQCNDDRTATFTLTNAVPQDPCFNQQAWKDMEKMAKTSMQLHCDFAGAKRYFVTGAVPTNKRIPSELDDKEGDQPRDYNRVSVPSAMWTAGCCDSSNAIHSEDKNKGFSFAYYGKNEPDSWVSPYTVVELEGQLETDYRIHTISIFADSCFSSSINSKKVLNELAVPVERKAAETLSSLSKSSESSLTPAKRRFVDSVNTNLHDNLPLAMKNWKFADADFGIIDGRNDIQNTRNLLSHSLMTTILTSPNFVKDEENIQSISTKLLTDDSNKLRYEGHSYEIEQEMPLGTKLSNGNNKDEYLVVPAYEATLSATGSRCRQDHNCDYHGKKYKWCYIDWSNHWDYCCVLPCGFHKDKNYAWCYTSQTRHWAYCSERSSMISISGRKCRADHECGTHGKSYHWCYTDTNKNWEYCCQPWHECAYHGEKYTWCYTGYKKKSSWKKCKY